MAAPPKNDRDQMGSISMVELERRYLFTFKSTIRLSHMHLSKLKVGMEHLPVEIFIHCITFMPLKSLILSRSICKEWRRLVPVADLLPLRRRLLEFFDTVLHSPYFLQTRPWTMDNLLPFDRQEYVDVLLVQYHAIPDAFRLWVLEWPARMALSCEWPGLPFVNCHSSNIQRRPGINFLGRLAPELSAIIYMPQTPLNEFVPALLIWSQAGPTTWLIFDDRPGLSGRVFVSYESNINQSSVSVSFGSEGSDDSEDEEVPSNYFSDWISYQENRWAKYGGASSSYMLQEHSLNPDPRDHRPDKPVTVNCIPAPSWVRCEEPVFQQRLLILKTD